MPFVSLHNHSELSFHAGVPSVKELVLRAKALGMRALALTDTDRMSGLIEFYKLCKEHGIRPVLGTELTQPDAPQEKVVLLARNIEGYRDICELLSLRHLNKDTFTLREAFGRHYPDLFFITAHPGVLQMLADTPNRRGLFAELLNQDAATRAGARVLAALAARRCVPTVVTNNTYFLDKADGEVHRILAAIGQNSTITQLNGQEYAPEEAWLKGDRLMRDLFPDQAVALANTELIARQCNVEFSFGKWILPEIEAPAGHTVASYLRQLAYAGLAVNYGGRPEYERAYRLQQTELEVIEKLGFPSYFLMVKQVRDWANSRLKQGFRRAKDCTIMRGSAANSITFYNIGASDLDPIRYNLYFQRFLNEERASPPDADLDFGWDERDAVIDYFFERWGQDNVAVLCTTNHFKDRAAFRETAKVFGFSEEQISSYFLLHEPIDEVELAKITWYAGKIRGKPRFLGQHPGGLIVTKDPIRRHVALERSGGTKDRVITQIDMHSGIDDLGLIKFDILGNGSLSVLRDTLAQLQEQGHPDPEVWNEPHVHHDAGVKDLIRNGRTRGVFYIESPAQTRLNKKAQAETFEEVGITSSIVRPAGAYYTKIFVERHRKEKQGIKDWNFLHPSLEKILGETHDCLVYQEDVIRICHEVAGLSYRRADRVRKMMNSLHEGAPDDYDRVAAEFIDGCMTVSGLSRVQAEMLWSGINTFTGFSFCKSHSLSYAQLSFKCAYLKAHYPAQFLAAVISNNHGFYGTSVYLNEARRFGIRINPFNINRCGIKYTGRGSFMLPGLMHIKGVRRASLEVVVAERERGGPYANLVDFMERTRVGTREAEALIKVGAFDCFGLNQPESLSLLYALHERLNPAVPSLFAGTRDLGVQLHPGLKDYTLTQKCINELEVLGFMFSGNMLDILDLHPAARNTVAAGSIEKLSGRRVKLFGLPITSRVHLVEDSGPMKFLTVEDMTGTADVVFWPDVYKRYAEVTNRPGPFEIWGTVKEDWGTYTVIADRIRNVVWTPDLVDFELASKRLLQSYTEQYTYREAAHAGTSAA